MTTANQEYYDASIRHQVALRRYTAGQVKAILKLLEEADADLTRMLRDRLTQHVGEPLDLTSQRYKRLIDDVRHLRGEAMQRYRDLVRTDLQKLAVVEHGAELKILQTSIPVDFQFAAVDGNQLRAIATSRPFRGRLLREWFGQLERSDQGRIVQTLRIGLSEGQTVDQIARRLAGTRANQYQDGILSMSRRDAVAVARTAINHVSNAAREEVWKANSDVIAARIWASVLDGRTSAVCRARDGHVAPVEDHPLPKGLVPLSPPDARPPAHINCRSTMVAYIDGVGLLGTRPTVQDTRTTSKRQVDFRREARQQGKPIQEIRRAWAEEHIGSVPSATTYQDWLQRQPAAFQDDVLGVAKGKLFRQGGLTLDQFVDRAGNELTLSQLADMDPAAFIRAGLNPNSY